VAGTDSHYSNADKTKMGIYSSTLIAGDSLADLTSSSINNYRLESPSSGEEHVLESPVAETLPTNNEGAYISAATRKGGSSSPQVEHRHRHSRSDRNILSTDEHIGINDDVALISSNTREHLDRVKRRRRRHGSHGHLSPRPQASPTDCRPVSTDLLWLRLSILHSDSANGRVAGKVHTRGIPPSPPISLSFSPSGLLWLPL